MQLGSSPTTRSNEAKRIDVIVSLNVPPTSSGLKPTPGVLEQVDAWAAPLQRIANSQGLFATALMPLRCFD
jgi:hypothetical protein